jgi:hypothetical protein
MYFSTFSLASCDGALDTEDNDEIVWNHSKDHLRYAIYRECAVMFLDTLISPFSLEIRRLRRIERRRNTFGFPDTRICAF